MAKNAAARKEAGKRETGGNRGKTMGKGAIKKGSAFQKSNASTKVGRTAPNGEKNVKGGVTQLRTESTIKRLKMYNSEPEKKHRRREQSLKPVRIQPDRRWFGNTRVIAQDKMQAFRETIAKGVEDPFSVVLKASKLPMSLLRDTTDKNSRMDLLSVQPFKETFSRKRQQKTVKLANYDMEAFLQATDKKTKGYETEKDKQLKVDLHTEKELDFGAGSLHGKHHSGRIFEKGTSKRIWSELYKVIDSSDVIVFVLDARDPMGTRCLQLEKDIRKNKPHKHIVLVLNKVDLVPTWVSRRWIAVLMKDFPTLAFHASISNPFGKNALLSLLKQFSTLMKDNKHVTVGMIGYPNVGKSSLINTLRRKKVCKTAPIPGETRIWQYVALTKKLFLLDCPGVVPAVTSDFTTDCAKVLKGVVRVERVSSCSDYIDEVLSRTKKQYLMQKYKLPLDTEWKDGEAFLTIIANRMGKLLKGGEPDLETAGRIVLYDWQRGRIPFFTMPPQEDLTKDAKGSGKGGPTTPAIEGDKEDKPVALEDGKAAEAAGAAAADAGAAGSSADGPVDEAYNEAADMAKKLLTTEQSGLRELNCRLEYDEEDRQGEMAPSARKEAQQAGGDHKGAKAKANQRKRQKAQKNKGGDSDEASGDEGDKKEGDQKATGSAKKKRRGGKGEVENPERRVDRNALPRNMQPGNIDWKAVNAEFGM